jgi:hypothetical protein
MFQKLDTVTDRYSFLTITVSSRLPIAPTDCSVCMQESTPTQYTVSTMVQGCETWQPIVQKVFCYNRTGVAQQYSGWLRAGRPKFYSLQETEFFSSFSYRDRPGGQPSDLLNGIFFRGKAAGA